MTRQPPPFRFYRTSRQHQCPTGVFRLLAMFAIMTIIGCSSKSEQPIDATLKPFADVVFELKTAAIPKALEEDNFEMAEYLMYVGAVIGEQGTVAAALAASGGSLDEVLENPSMQQSIAKAWDRANQRLVEWVKSSNSLKDQTVQQADGKPLDAQTALLQVLTQPTDQSDITGKVRKRMRLNDKEWTDLEDSLKERLPKDMYDVLVIAQEKYDIRNHCKS